MTGASDVMDGQAVLTGSAGVTANDHTAPITLGRGGTVRVCQTSVLHLTREPCAQRSPAPLLFSLDRGAIEIQTDSTPNDSIMTPDLRFTVHNAGPLDLRLRIARNGDTCVENRGPGAPTLAVSDPFGESMYEVAPGQHRALRTRQPARGGGPRDVTLRLPRRERNVPGRCAARAAQHDVRPKDCVASAARTAADSACCAGCGRRAAARSGRGS